MLHRAGRPLFARRIGYGASTAQFNAGSGRFDQVTGLFGGIWKQFGAFLLAFALAVALAGHSGTVFGQESGDIDALIPETGDSVVDGPPAGEIRILAFGASIVEGYGLPATESLPVQLEAALEQRGYDVTVVNAGVSGDTTAAGAARLGWTLADRFDIAILALGSNDALRAIEPAETRANLDSMLSRLAQETHMPVLLVGMYAPRNIGADYVAEFDAIYPDLAEEHDVALMPFLLDGVALQPDLNQSDGIHPNAIGVAIIVEKMIPHLLPLVDEVVAAKAAEEDASQESISGSSASEETVQESATGPSHFKDDPPDPGTDRATDRSGEPAGGSGNP